MARCRLHPLALAVILLAPLLVALPSVRGDEAGAALDRGLFRELRWRPIGPFRGGRTKAATGVRGKPGLFYIGVVNGGVWKTTDYGRTWQPLFDDQPTGSIGAIAVAPSNPDVIYVGSGEGMQRPDLSTGDGIYRSTDGGQDLEAPRPARRPADPADRRGPEGREEALRRRARPPVRAERGARRLPLDRRGRDVPEGPLPRRGHGRRRRRPRPERPGHGVRGPLGVAAGAVGERRVQWRGKRPLQVHRRRPELAAAQGRPPHLRRGPRADRDHGRAERPAAALRHRRGAGQGRPLPLRRRRRDVVPRQLGPARRRPPRRRRRGARPPDEPRRRLRPDDRHVEVHGRREDVHGLPRRAGRRRLPAHLDRPRPTRT